MLSLYAFADLVPITHITEDSDRHFSDGLDRPDATGTTGISISCRGGWAAERIINEDGVNSDYLLPLIVFPKALSVCA